MHHGAEVDLERGLLVFGDSKTRKSVRPLGTAAIALLAALGRDPRSDFVFPAESGSGHYVGTKRVWPRVVERAGLPGVTPHTLRHTVGSTAVSTGEAPALTGAILGHANARSTALYAHVSASWACSPAAPTACGGPRGRRPGPAAGGMPWRRTGCARQAVNRLEVGTPDRRAKRPPCWERDARRVDHRVAGPERGDGNRRTWARKLCPGFSRG